MEKDQGKQAERLQIERVERVGDERERPHTGAEMETDRPQREEALQEKRQRTERNEIKVEAVGKTSQSSFQWRRKKGKMTNIFLIDCDEEAIVDYVKKNCMTRPLALQEQGKEG